MRDSQNQIHIQQTTIFTQFCDQSLVKFLSKSFGISLGIINTYSDLMMKEQQQQLPNNQFEANQTLKEEIEQDKAFKQSFTRILYYLQRLIMPNRQTDDVDLDILLDILQQGIEQDRKLLEIFIIQQIRISKGRLVDKKLLVDMMLQKLKQFDLKLDGNLKKWWNTFSSLGTGAGTKTFEIKTLLKYINHSKQGKILSKRLEQVFKSKNVLTYQQLSAAIKSSDD